MPLLDRNQIQALWDAPFGECRSCQKKVRKNYCRECDEFFVDGHSEDCPDREEHQDHRKYPVEPQPLCSFCHSVLGPMDGSDRFVCPQCLV